jgi:WD40 repeat protein
MFIGCSSGIIRVINMESEPIEDLKPLFNPNKSQPKSPVTTIDISPGMLYLVSGHQNGMLSLWDMKKFKLLTLIKDDSVHDSEIRAAKFYSIQEENTIGIISVEAKGPVRKIEVDKNISFLSLGTKSYSV